MAAPLDFDSVVGVRVVCRRDLNVSRALLVLGRILLKRMPPSSVVARPP